jgi:hypothetical protein
MTARTIKWLLAGSLSKAKSRYFCYLTCHPLAAYFSLRSLLASVYIYGLSVGESPPHTNFNMRSHPQEWCTQKILEECF